jgi:hypothetical protein
LRIEGVAWSAQRIPTAVIIGFLNRNRCFSFKQLHSYPHEAEWPPFQTHYFSENLVLLGIELGTSRSVAKNPDHLATETEILPSNISVWKNKGNLVGKYPFLELEATLQVFHSPTTIVLNGSPLSS